MQISDFRYAELRPSVKQSEFGVGALLLAAINVVGLVLCFGVPAVMHWSKQNISQGLGLLFGLSFFAVFLFSLLGMLVALVGVFQPRRKKTLAVIALCVNGLSSLVLALMIVPEILKSF